MARFSGSSWSAVWPARASWQVWVVALMVVLALPSVSVWLFVRWDVLPSWEQATAARLSQSVADRTHRLSLVLDETRHTTAFVAALPSLRSMDPAQQRPLLQSLHAAYPWVATAFVTDGQGQQTVRDNAAPLTSVQDQPFALSILQQHAPESSAVLPAGPHRSAWVWAVPVSGSATAMSTGLLAVVVPTDLLWQRVSEAGPPLDGSTLYLLDAQGQLLVETSHPGASTDVLQNLSMRAPFEHRPRLGDAPALVSFTDDGRPFLAAVEVAPNGWVVVAEAPQFDFWQSVVTAQNRLGLVLLVSLTLSFVALWTIVRIMTRPLIDLAQATESMAQDADLLLHRHIVPHTTRRDEVGHLARSIERLYVSLRTALGMIQRRANDDLERSERR